MDFDTLDMVKLDTLGSADLSLEAFLAGDDVSELSFEDAAEFMFDDEADEADALDTFGA